MAHKPDLPPTVKFAPDAVVQVIDRDALVLKLQDEAVFSLNETGARVAELIAARLPVDRIVEILAAEYEHERRDIEADVYGLVRTLLARGLLVPAEEDDLS